MTRKAGEEVASPAFYAQGCVRKLAALLHAPRAASREDESSLLDFLSSVFLSLFCDRLSRSKPQESCFLA